MAHRIEAAPAAAEPVRPAGQAERVWFADVASTHWAGSEPGLDFEKVLGDFEDENGRVVESYWCGHAPAGTALTYSEPRRGPILRRLTGDTGTWQLHRALGKLVEHDAPAGFLFHRIDILQVKAQNALSGMSRQICLHWLFAETSHLLSYLDARHEKRGSAETQHRAALAEHEEELDAIGRYYREAATREAQVVYFSGMLIGVLVVALLLAPLAVVLDRVYVEESFVQLETFVACAVAGALGAMVSVLTRMSSGHFHVNHEVGREYVRRLGSFRPFIGAVFGLALYFAATSELLPVTLPEDPSQRFALLTVMAFLAGFSERFAKEMLRTSEDAAAGAGPQAIDDQPATRPTATRDGSDGPKHTSE